VALGPDVAPVGTTLRRGEGLSGRVWETREPLIVNDYDHWEGRMAIFEEVLVGAVVGVPVHWGEEFLGVLNISAHPPRTFSPADAELLTFFATHAAIAIENARLYEQAQREITERNRADEELRYSYVKLQRTLEGTVHVLVSAIEMRDPYTAGHQRRAAQLACAIANEMNLPREQIEGLRVAGMIHDLGKISVPAEILSKPGRLTELEYGLIKMHPQVGYDILKGIDFPWPVADIVMQHHERMDGSGYPHGLSGAEIMLEARTLAVADVVEAMASHRPYRPALGIEKALEEVSGKRGELYDPEAVDAFVKLFTEGGLPFQ
jgi:HD-GYP domain-containing protein (c-di-GMP phosphodiesterase class II)